MTLVVNRHDHCWEADGIQTVLLYDQSHVLRDLLMSGSMAQCDGVDRYRPGRLYVTLPSAANRVCWMSCC